MPSAIKGSPDHRQTHLITLPLSLHETWVQQVGCATLARG